MNTHRLIFLFSVIILLLGICPDLICWAEGVIVFAYRGTTYMIHPNDTVPTLTRITEEGISTPSPDGRFLAAVDSDPDRRNLLHIRDLPLVRKFVPSCCKSILTWIFLGPRMDVGLFMLAVHKG